MGFTYITGDYSGFPAASAAPAKVFDPANYAHANTRYVATTGNDSNAGTSSGAAWLTLGKAVSSAPADCLIRVAPGSYPASIGMSGKTNLSFVGDTLDPTQRPYIKANAAQIIYIANSTHITWDNFKIEATDNGSTNWGSPVFMGDSGAVHHITIRNCEILGVNSSTNGIHVYSPPTTSCDYLTFEDNYIHKAPGETALGWNSSFGPSGISVFEPKQLDTVSGAHIIIRRNFIAEVAQNHISNGIGSSTITDGNCIIIDLARTYSYAQRVDIYNNICVYPGAQGINIYAGSNPVNVYNNTVYQPGRCVGQTTCNGSGNGGGICFNSASNIKSFNNVVNGRPGATTSKSNFSLSGSGTAGYTCSYQTTGNDFPGTGDITSNPMWSNPSTSSTDATDWIPLVGSPLLLAGTATFSGIAAPTTDYFGHAMSSPPCIGACL